jgi:hypothetical protein
MSVCITVQVVGDGAESGSSSSAEDSDDGDGSGSEGGPEDMDTDASLLDGRQQPRLLVRLSRSTCRCMFLYQL